MHAIDRRTFLGCVAAYAAGAIAKREPKKVEILVFDSVEGSRVEYRELTATASEMAWGMIQVKMIQDMDIPLNVDVSTGCRK